MWHSAKLSLTLYCIPVPGELLFRVTTGHVTLFYKSSGHPFGVVV
jgi:hypothetical protein